MRQQGFMILLGAIIVTSAVIIVGVAISSGKLAFKRDVLNSDLGSRNFATTQACLEEAVYRHAECDGCFTSTQLILNDQLCNVTVQNNQLPHIITAQGVNDDRYRWLEAEVDRVGGQWTVIDWREVTGVTPNN